MSHHLRRRAAFTLVELLVVISIIAVLLAILLPALGNARQVAQQMLCQTNVKQMHLATMLYANDFEGYGPADINTNVGAGGTQWNIVYARWMIKLSPYVNGPRASEVSNLGTAVNAIDKQVALFQCPTTWESPNWGAGHSYGMNQYVATDYNSSALFQTPANFERMHTDIDLSNFYLLSDSYIYTNTGTLHWNRSIGAVSPLTDVMPKYHRDQQLNFAFGDGHVEARKAEGHIYYMAKRNPHPTQQYFTATW